MSSLSPTASLPDYASSFLNPSEPEIRTTGSKNLGVNDFLKLITVQLTNQDPLKPMEDTQFISQMASFTSLEQMQTLSKNVKQSSAQDYLGRSVTVIEDQVPITGVVTKVTYAGASCLLTINGREYETTTVRSISTAGAAAAAPATPAPTNADGTANTTSTQTENSTAPN